MSATPGLRAAVVGLGRMGMHHVRACVDAEDVDLVAILDHKPDWAVEVGADTQSLVAADIESLFGKVDLAIVAVPTADHASTAVPLLEHGISCLVEKPIAGTEEEAAALIEAAGRSGAVLQVGHIERYNPAFGTLQAVMSSHSPVKHITTQRHNPPQDRMYDVDAVLDLMTHDLDLMALIAGSGPPDIAIAGSSTEHRVTARLSYPNGLVVELSVDREASNPARTMRVETEDVSYVIDYSSQTLYRHSTSGVETVAVAPADALRQQLRSFAKSVQTKEITGTSGHSALDTLRLANSIRRAAGLV